MNKNPPVQQGSNDHRSLAARPYFASDEAQAIADRSPIARRWHWPFGRSSQRPLGRSRQRLVVVVMCIKLAAADGGEPLQQKDQ